MKVMIYGIGGEFAEQFVGCAYDATTGLNLLRLLKDTGSYACSLHGGGLDKMCAVSGEETIDRAMVMFTVAAEREPAASKKPRWAETVATIKWS